MYYPFLALLIAFCYCLQPQVLDETSEHRQGQQIGVVHPLNINHQETSAVAARQLVAAREESVSSSTLRNMNVEATRSQASTRRSAEERVNGVIDEPFLALILIDAVLKNVPEY